MYRCTFIHYAARGRPGRFCQSTLVNPNNSARARVMRRLPEWTHSLTHSLIRHSLTHSHKQHTHKHTPTRTKVVLGLSTSDFPENWSCWRAVMHPFHISIFYGHCLLKFFARGGVLEDPINVVFSVQKLHLRLGLNPPG